MIEEMITDESESDKRKLLVNMLEYLANANNKSLEGDDYELVDKIAETDCYNPLYPIIQIASGHLKKKKLSEGLRHPVFAYLKSDGCFELKHKFDVVKIYMPTKNQDETYTLKFKCLKKKLLNVQFPGGMMQHKKSMVTLQAQVQLYAEYLLEEFPLLKVFSNVCAVLVMLNSGRVRRDKNIAAILVDSTGKIISYSYSVCSDNHAEVNVLRGNAALINAYDKKVKHYLITSLYPCTQCQGKLTMFKVDLCVYLEPDPQYYNILVLQEKFLTPTVQLPNVQFYFKDSLPLQKLRTSVEPVESHSSLKLIKKKFKNQINRVPNLSDLDRKKLYEQICKLFDHEFNQCDYLKA